MIKAHLSDGSFLMGLSALNVQKLKEGLPIVFDGRPFGLSGQVIIVYGETEDQIMKDFLMASGVGGSG